MVSMSDQLNTFLSAERVQYLAYKNTRYFWIDHPWTFIPTIPPNPSWFDSISIFNHTHFSISWRSLSSDKGFFYHAPHRGSTIRQSLKRTMTPRNNATSHLKRRANLYLQVQMSQSCSFSCWKRSPFGSCVSDLERASYFDFMPVNRLILWRHAHWLRAAIALIR